MTKKVAQFTPVGKETLRRCTLKSERRLYNNSGETILNKKIFMSNREKLANILDIRTVGAKHMTGNRSLFRECNSLLLDDYVNFGLKSNTWEAAKKKRNQGHHR